MQNFTLDDVKILEKQTAYKGYFRIECYKLQHKLFQGGWSEPMIREVFERGNAVAVLLYDPTLNKVVLIEQFRMGAINSNHPWLLELVAGIIEPNETPEQVAKREIHEEAGLKPLDIIPIYHYWTSPGGSTEKVSLFCARVDASQAGGIHGLSEEHENIKVWVFDTQKIFTMLENGEIQNAISLIALQWLKINEEKIKAKWGR